jgi:tRNA (guanine-N7-)-methyltransferase
LPSGFRNASADSDAHADPPVRRRLTPVVDIGTMPPMTTMDECVCPPPAESELFSPVAVFGREAPFELEIGCGKGGFLLRRAKAHPEFNLLGIEWANKFFQYAADRMARWGMTHVRVMRTDARHFVMHHLPESCLSALHVYHPDPWPKKRHHKRRLFQTEFITAATRALVPGGRWAIQTDHAEYFDWIRERMAGVGTLEQIDYDDPAYGIVDASAQTNFEIKYVREGRAIYRLAFRKTPAPSCAAGD